MKKIVFSLLMLVPFGLVSCFSGASKSSTEEIETQKMQQQKLEISTNQKTMNKCLLQNREKRHPKKINNFLQKVIFLDQPKIS